MEIHLLIEDEAVEDDGTRTEVICAYMNKAKAEAAATSVNAGRYRSRRVETVQVVDEP